MASERDILQAAIAATEKEIFDESMDLGDNALENTGERSIEAMGDGLEGQHEPDEDEDDDEGEPAAEGEGEVETEPKGEVEAEPEPAVAAAPKPADGRVPPGVLRDANTRARAAEAERDTLKAQLDGLNAKLDGLLARPPQPAPQPQQQVQPKPAEVIPDLLEDPIGYAKYLETNTQNRVDALNRQWEERTFNQSMTRAQTQHGQAFVNAFEALKTQAQQNPQIARAIRAAPDPGEAVIQWHKRAEAMREIGDDPEQFRTKVAEQARAELMNDPEFRKQVLEGLRSGAQTGDNGRPRTTTNLPPSLRRAAGGNARAVSDTAFLDGSEQAVFTSAFST